MRRLAVLLALALGACTTPFEIEVEAEPPRLVLNALFAADSVLTFDLSASRPALAPIDAAEVRAGRAVLWADGARAGTAAFDPAAGRFVSDVRPRPGQRIRVRVEAAGFEPIEAEDVVPPRPPFALADFERGPGATNRTDRVTVRFEDPPGDDYYALYGSAERSYPAVGGPPQRGPLPFRSDDPVLADGYLVGLFEGGEGPLVTRAYFRDLPFAGGSAAIRLDVRRQGPDPTGESVVTDRLGLARLSPTYYRYVLALALETPGPFGDAPVLPSNVAGGYGVFAAFAATEQALP